MKCSECNKSGKYVLFSNPPKVRCKVTGEYHLFEDECNLSYTIPVSSKSSISVSCIICGESIKLSENEELSLMHGHHIIKVCEECKEAISYMKRNVLSEKMRNGDEKVSQSQLCKECSSYGLDMNLCNYCTFSNNFRYFTKKGNKK